MATTRGVENSGSFWCWLCGLARTSLHFHFRRHLLDSSVVLYLVIPDAVELLSMMSSPCVEGIATTDFDSGLGVLPCSADDVLDRTGRQSDSEVSSASDLSSADDCPPSTSNEILLNFFMRESSESCPLCSNHTRQFEISVPCRSLMSM